MHTKRCLYGNPQQKVAAVDDPKIRAQLLQVEQLWADYKQSILGYLDNPTDSTNLRALHEGSTLVLKEMNDAVLMMENLANRDSQTEVLLAATASVIVLILVTLGRMFGMTELMQHIRNLQTHLEAVMR